MRTYEAMFLLDSGTADFEVTAAPVREVLARIKAEVLVLKPWDDRRLAYEIKGRKRGLYVLTYFKAEPVQIAPLQHEIQLEERILRALVLSAEEVTPEKMQAETPVTARGSSAGPGRPESDRSQPVPAREAAGPADQPLAPDAQAAATEKDSSQRPPAVARSGPTPPAEGQA